MLSEEEEKFLTMIEEEGGAVGAKGVAAVAGVTTLIIRTTSF